MNERDDRDPLGRRALFGPPQVMGAVRRVGDGKESLYSAASPPPAERAWGTVVVECSSCRARTRISLVEFAWRHLPVWLWVPWLRYSQLMSCPACERRTWLGVSCR